MLAVIDIIQKAEEMQIIRLQQGAGLIGTGDLGGGDFACNGRGIIRVGKAAGREQ